MELGQCIKVCLLRLGKSRVIHLYRTEATSRHSSLRPASTPTHPRQDHYPHAAIFRPTLGAHTLHIRIAATKHQIYSKQDLCRNAPRWPLPAPQAEHISANISPPRPGAAFLSLNPPPPQSCCALANSRRAYLARSQVSEPLMSSFAKAVSSF